MNTPKEQAELFRKAADTIEMCAKHDIAPIIKYLESKSAIYSINLEGLFKYYEFPIAVIEGELIWKDTVVYDCNGNATTGANMMEQYKPYSLKPKPLCMVEGKPVYKGDEVYDGNGIKIIVDLSDGLNIFGRYCSGDRACWDIKLCSWSPKPKTIMVEMLEEDALMIAESKTSGWVEFDRVSNACRAALNKQQGT